jgi:uncharacterized membrane protein
MSGLKSTVKSEMIESFFIQLERHPVVSAIASLFFSGLLGSVLSAWAYEELGYIAIVPIITVISLIILSIALNARNVKKKRKDLEAKPTTEPLRERYKGLIVSISRLSDSYLFNWDTISECDRERLQRFLLDELGLGWVDDAEITKTDDHRTLRISKDEHSAVLTINDTKDKATLKISNGRTLNLKVKREGRELRVYTATKDGVMNTIKELVKGPEDAAGLRELYKVRGVGQTFRAINHHLGQLKVCWLLCTDDVKEGKEVVEYFIEEFGKKTVEIKIVPLENPNKIERVHKAIKEIYETESKNYRLEEKEVIADVTGGTAIMSSAMTLACISPQRDMEYVEQKTYNLIKIDENIMEVIHGS